MVPDSQICTVEQLSAFHDENKPIPFGQARHCTHPAKPTLTVVAYALMREYAEGLLWEHDLLERVELLDLRTLYPLDMEAILRSGDVTRQLLIVEPDVAFGGIGAEIAAQVAEALPGTLIRRLGAPRTTISARPEERELYVPSREQILEAIRELV